MMFRSIFAALILAAPAPALAAEAPPNPADTNPNEAMAAPQVIAVRGAELGALLESAGWVHKGDARFPLYTVGFRSCPDCLNLKLGAYDKMEAAGADIRRILYARPDSAEGKPRSRPGERAMIAELWKTRDWALYERWHEIDPQTFYESEPLPPDADSDPERAAWVMKSRDFFAALKDILAANGITTYVPVSIWQENGQWVVYVGYDPKTFDALVVERLKAR